MSQACESTESTALTGLDNQLSPYGTRFVFGEVNAGDGLVFFIDVLDTGDRLYSDKRLNAGGINYTWAKPYGGDLQVPAGFNLACEDLLGGGDFSYYDHSFVIGTEQVGNVAEPASLAVLGPGLAGLGFSRRKKA